MPNSYLEVEQLGEASFGPCACCGNPTRRVWGFAHRSATDTEAAYFVEWVPGAVAQHGATFDVIIGRWGGNSSAADRSAVSLALRYTEEGPGFMVIDAAGRPHAGSEMVGVVLDRDAVLASDMGKRAFAVVDAVWLDDGRIAEVVSASG